MIRRFNRDTVWLAAGVLGTVIFAALVLAIQERQSKVTQADRVFLLNPDSASLGSVVASTSNADSKMTPVPGSSVDHAFIENSSTGNSFLTDGIRSINSRSRFDS